MRFVLSCALSLVMIVTLINCPPAQATETPIYPYAHADLSSPRATILTFKASAAEASKLVTDAYRLRHEEGGLFASRRVKAMIRQAEILIDTAAHTLDLSRIPPATLAHEKVDLVLQLKEIFDRIPLPEVSEIPDAAAVREAGEQPILRWRLPDTELLIVQLNDDTHAGEFVFSASSVSRIPAIYEALASSPDHVDDQNVYLFDSLAPGNLLPPIWYAYVEAGPEWLKMSLAGQAVWQWFAVVLWFIFAGMTMAFVMRWRSPLGNEEETGTHFMRKSVAPLALAALAGFFLYVILDEISLAGTAYFVAEVIGQIFLTFALAWLCVLTCQAAAELIISSPSILPDSLDAHLLRVGFRVLGLVLAALLWSQMASRIGVPLLGVLAGLGIGGLAIALAAQPTIENFIGGVILFADRPVRTGEFCRCGDVVGTVEEIGIRSTRIRALDRTLISIPNSEFAKAQIINFTRRDYHMFETIIGIRVDTRPAHFQRLLSVLHREFGTHPLVMPETFWVRFEAIQGDSLVIHLRAFLQIADYNDFLREKEKVLLSIMKHVEESGCDFALPSRRLYPVQGGEGIAMVAE